MTCSVIYLVVCDLPGPGGGKHILTHWAWDALVGTAWRRDYQRPPLGQPLVFRLREAAQRTADRMTLAYAQTYRVEAVAESPYPSQQIPETLHAPTTTAGHQ